MSILNQPLGMSCGAASMVSSISTAPPAPQLGGDAKHQCAVRVRPLPRAPLRRPLTLLHGLWWRCRHDLLESPVEGFLALVAAKRAGRLLEEAHLLGFIHLSPFLWRHGSSGFSTASSTGAGGSGSRLTRQHVRKRP